MRIWLVRLPHFRLIVKICLEKRNSSASLGEFPFFGPLERKNWLKVLTYLCTLHSSLLNID